MTSSMERSAIDALCPCFELKIAILTVRKRELEYRIPRSHSPVNSRRFPELFGDFCNNKTSFL